jgi:hypothetical protein
MEKALSSLSSFLIWMLKHSNLYDPDSWSVSSARSNGRDEIGKARSLKSNHTETGKARSPKSNCDYNHLCVFDHIEKVDCISEMMKKMEKRKQSWNIASWMMNKPENKEP